MRLWISPSVNKKLTVWNSEIWLLIWPRARLENFPPVVYSRPGTDYYMLNIHLEIFWPWTCCDGRFAEHTKLLNKVCSIQSIESSFAKCGFLFWHSSAQSRPQGIYKHLVQTVSDQQRDRTSYTSETSRVKTRGKFPQSLSFTFAKHRLWRNVQRTTAQSGLQMKWTRPLS